MSSVSVAVERTVNNNSQPVSKQIHPLNDSNLCPAGQYSDECRQLAFSPNNGYGSRPNDNSFANMSPCRYQPAQSYERNLLNNNHPRNTSTFCNCSNDYLPCSSTERASYQTDNCSNCRSHYQQSHPSVELTNNRGIIECFDRNQRQPYNRMVYREPSCNKNLNNSCNRDHYCVSTDRRCPSADKGYNFPIQNCVDDTTNDQPVNRRNCCSYSCRSTEIIDDENFGQKNNFRSCNYHPPLRQDILRSHQFGAHALNRSLLPPPAQQHQPPMMPNRMKVSADVYDCNIPLATLNSNTKSSGKLDAEFDVDLNLNSLNLRPHEPLPLASFENIADDVPLERSPTVMERRMQAQSQSVYHSSNLRITDMATNLASYLNENQLYVATCCYLESAQQ